MALQRSVGSTITDRKNGSTGLVWWLVFCLLAGPLYGAIDAKPHQEIAGAVKHHSLDGVAHRTETPTTPGALPGAKPLCDAACASLCLGLVIQASGHGAFPHTPIDPFAWIMGKPWHQTHPQKPPPKWASV